MTVPPAIALLGAIIALQLYQIVFLHQFSPVCQCSSSPHTNPSAPTTAQKEHNNPSSAPPPTNAAASAVARATSPPSPPPRVRPSQQAPQETAKSTRELLNELSQIKGDEVQEAVSEPVKPSYVSSGGLGAPVVETGLGGAVPKGISVPDAPPSTGQMNIGNAGAARPEQINMRMVDFLNQVHPQGIGIVLGVGRSPVSLELLRDWRASPGLYMADPFIHIWKGYDDPANVNDKEHQMIFEDLRNKLQIYEGRYSLVRDFSSSFAVTFKGTPGSPPASLVYVDNNPDSNAVFRDLTDWYPTLAPNGVLAGPGYNRDSVRNAVHSFAQKNAGSSVGLFSDGQTWFITKGMGGMGMLR